MFSFLLAILLLNLVLSSKNISENRIPTLQPIVVWHPLGSSSMDSYTTNFINQIRKYTPPSTYIYSVRIGENDNQDRYFSYFDDANRQIEEVCNKIRSNSLLNTKEGFHAVGLSQGGLMLRAVIQKCPDLTILSLTTFGSPLQGTASYPGCGKRYRPYHPGIKEKFFLQMSASGVGGSLFSSPSSSSWTGAFGRMVGRLLHGDNWEQLLPCSIITALVSASIYHNGAQSTVMPAQYFKDPYQMDTYRLQNLWLQDLNNEMKEKNLSYKEGIKKLLLLNIFSFSDEDVVFPKESTNLGWTDGEHVIPLRNLLMYEEDWIGLRFLDEQGRIRQTELLGKHLDIHESIVGEFIHALLEL